LILGHLKIRTRIYAGFGSLIVLGLVVAAVGSWGIDDLGRQTVILNALAGTSGNVASAIKGEELIARVMLHDRDEPADELIPQFHQALDKVRQSLTEARSTTLSAVRKGIYQSVLDRLDAQAQSADKMFDMGHTMGANRDRMVGGGEALAAATARLTEAAVTTQTLEAARAAAAIERAVLLVRIANWRFQATNDPAGPAAVRTGTAAAALALDTFEKLNVPDMLPLIQPVRVALATYSDEFAMMAPALLGLIEAYDTVQLPMVIAIQADLGKAEDSLRHDSTEAATHSAKLRDSSSETQMVVAGLGLIGGLAMAFFVGRGIARPITAMTTTMGTLAAGDHDVAILGADSRDEIGDMARAVNVFKTNMIEAERLAAEQDVARAARSRRQDAMDRHTEVFGQSVTGVMSALGTAAGNMRRAAGVMAESSVAVHDEASETAGGAGKSSADLTAVAAAVEQFTASVGEISRQVAVASDVASQAVRRAETSQATIRGLADSTARIGDVVRLIDSIAGQTNLLALNATIEAARAGDAGKGFAVVAGEVKALAAQTARATAEIGAQIETVRAATEETVAAMNDIGGIIGRMGDVSTAISAAVEEQSVTTREIASSIEGVAGSTAQAAQAMVHVVEVADQAGEASRKILSEAAEISSESEKLRLEVEQFLKAVQSDTGERRRFERIAGNGVAATLRLPGKTAMKATISDLSRGGVALRHSGAVEVGWDVEVDLPEAGGPVTGRVVRVEGGLVSIAFSDTPAMLVRVDRSLASLSAARKAA
jgi:methyl-accepting chemotaxis protein